MVTVFGNLVDSPQPTRAGGGSRLVGVELQDVRFRGVGAPEARSRKAYQILHTTQQCVVRLRHQGDDEIACHEF